MKYTLMDPVKLPDGQELKELELRERVTAADIASSFSTPNAHLNTLNILANLSELDSVTVGAISARDYFKLNTILMELTGMDAAPGE
jgi:hypothetical protein